MALAAVAAAVALGGAIAINNAGGSKGLGRGPNGDGRPPAAASDTSTARVPHNNVVDIYNLFGLRQQDSDTLDGLIQRFESEGYVVHEYEDQTEGAGSQGGATLANFVAMAKEASVIIINGHGFDDSGATQSCETGKGLGRCDRPIEPGASEPATTSTPPTVPETPPEASIGTGLQVEWYPTWDDEQKAYAAYVADGYDPAWLINPKMGNSAVYAPTLIPWRPGDSQIRLAGGKLDTSEGLRPWLGISSAGIAHFFKGHQLDLVDVLDCHSMVEAPSFDARSYFGHANAACSQFEAVDEPTLFDRLIGKSGVPARSTTEAMNEGGFIDKFFGLSADSKPVVLSPAVESVSPAPGSRVAPNSTTGAEVRFDAEMDTSNTSDVVTVSGCGASAENMKWPETNRLAFDLKLPKNPSDTTLTVTVHKDRAQASPGGFPNQQLDGNADPTGSDSGLAPNRDDYTYQLSCSDSSSNEFKTVYSGTYELNYTRTGPNQAPVTETASFTWTETQTLSFTTAADGTSESITTTLDAHGTYMLDQPGGIDGSNGLHVSCTIQTPPHYQWVATTLVPQASGSGEMQLGFSWSISSPPPPGNPGVTASPTEGPPSGCQSDTLGFMPQLGIPEPSDDASHVTLDATQSQTFQDAEVGHVTLQSNQLPTTKRFDIDAQKSTTEFGITNAGTMKLHGTLTFSRV